MSSLANKSIKNILLQNVMTDHNGGLAASGLDTANHCIVGVVGQYNAFFIPYQYGGLWYVAVRYFPTLEEVASTVVGNVRVYYIDRNSYE